MRGWQSELEDNRTGGSEAEKEIPAAGGDAEGGGSSWEAPARLAQESRLLSLSRGGGVHYVSIVCVCVEIG